MRWRFWRRQGKRDASSSVAVEPEPRPVHVPGRDTVLAGESHYLVPNDLLEANRLDLQHFAMREYFGTNIFAPVQAPRRILDAACGTGRWAKEVAQQFPGAEVVGIDVSVTLEIQEKGPPSEYTFIQANVFDPLPFPDGHFDYTHMRFIFSATPVQKWPEMVRELVRVTAPGGWIELVEANVPADAGPAFEQINVWGRQILGARGVDLSLGSQVGRFLREAGVVPVTERSDGLPMGPYAGRVGQIVAADIFTAYRSVIQMYAQALGIDEKTIRGTIDQADADVFSGQYHARLPIYIAYGQRPPAD
jgi:SAM-dependent methyltransferase